MKNIFLQLGTGILYILLIGLTGCMDNKYEVINDDNLDRLLTEFSEGRSEIIQKNFNPSSTPLTVELVNVQAVFRSAISSEYTVTIASNPSLVTTYNAQNGTTLKAAPSNVIALSSTSYTINASQRKVPVQAQINTNALLSDNYAVGLTITQVSQGEISAIAKDIIIVLGVKNLWDGNYRIKGRLEGHPTLSGPINDNNYPCGTFSLVTSSANSVELYDAQPYGSGSALGLFGVYPRFNIDPATNKVTVTDAAGGLSSVQNFTDYDSRFDPATKTFYIKWGWNGTRVAYDTLTYCGPR